ncbi:MULTISPECIES: ABC transporter permease [Pseudonocardia]|uniref:Peptide/nickel transport system permease protein n=1 Tax=Pseudonocardia alni TaxID=33907 RepID=A0A852WC73_PSEA5|nr:MULTISPECIES: ABC transporter permease [Pseudonocardia]MYW75870.1 ABC transporter permease subunit [Pseudonocardia sp. SID8383]NYG04891.1 peptide/nickel transport system permease protein [Pseudonocardia antarctica]OJG06989.1 Dipeptide transport system permease protein DppB [Pseudonocardia autotrophica]
MLGLLARRLAFTVPMLVVVSFCVFSLIVLVPGDPAVALAGENPAPEQIAAVRERLGLDDPFLVQFWHWFSGVLQGDLGQSLFSSQSVADAVFSRLPATLSLALLSLAVALVLGVAVGVLAAMRPGTWIDRVATFAASLGVAVPYFWVGMILVLLFAINLTIFPAVGYVPLTENPLQWFLHLFLPATALGLAPAAVIARQTRAGMTGVLCEDYVRTATAKGLPPARVVGQHALKNAAVPVVTAFGLEASRLIGGTVVIEQLFALPGLGNLAYTSVFARDFPMVQGVLLVVAALVLLINLLVDLSYGYFNPRIRQS